MDAAKLVAGHRLLNDDASWAEVVSVWVVEEPLLAYNLTDEEFHTYFVAANENAAPVWVHNGPCLPPVNRVVNSKAPRVVDKAIERDLGFASRADANQALEELKPTVSSASWPEGTIMAYNKVDVLVPYGSGYVVYQVKNGKAIVKTSITAEMATTFVPGG